MNLAPSRLVASRIVDLELGRCRVVVDYDRGEEAPYAVSVEHPDADAIAEVARYSSLIDAAQMLGRQTEILLNRAARERRARRRRAA